MGIELGKVGVWLRGCDATPELAQQAESLGYGAVWVGGSPSGDLERIRTLLDATSIPIATGIINVWASPAAQTADAWSALPAAHQERLLLGIGIGHREATAEYRSPFDTLSGYIDDLRRAGVPQEHLALAALGPRARLVDALVLHGTPADIAAGVRAHLDAGADHVCVQPLGDDVAGQLSGLAPALLS